jgi:hypothetical protein
MTVQIALENIYNATRLAPLTAQQHEFLAECAKVIAEALPEKQETEE